MAKEFLRRSEVLVSRLHVRSAGVAEDVRPEVFGDASALEPNLQVPLDGADSEPCAAAAYEKGAGVLGG